MVVVDRSAIVSHSAARLYDLVADVEAYPRFLPWCSGAEIIRRDGALAVVTLHITYRGLRQRFTTENLGTPGSSLSMSLVSGPFRRLKGEWRFEPLSEHASRVSLHLEYEIASRLLERMLGPAFRNIADTFVDAFVRRAESAA